MGPHRDRLKLFIAILLPFVITTILVVFGHYLTEWIALHVMSSARTGSSAEARHQPEPTAASGGERGRHWVPHPRHD